MTRREVFEKLLITSATAVGPGCATKRISGPVARRSPSLHFPPVYVSADRITRTTVGLRPFRPSGFLLKAEKLDSKLLVHNYGHGGGGMTLSWGTSDLAVEIAIQSGAREYAVLGAGGVGLAAARLLQRRGMQVTIYAKSLPPDTTSNKSGAQWWPVSVFDRDRLTAEFRELFLKAASLSYQHYQTMVGDEYGIRLVRNYLLSDTPPEGFLMGQQSPARDIYPELRDLRPEEHPFGAPYARQFDTMIIEPQIYLNAMLRDVQVAGGRVEVKELHSKQELAALPEPVIVNCTGLGSRELIGDDELMPIKGQLSVLLPQPEIDYTVLQDHYYMFPRRDGILLGGTFERNVWDLSPDRQAERQVIEAHQRIFAPLL